MNFITLNRPDVYNDTPIKNGKIESDGTPLDLIETSPFLKSSLTKQDIISKQKLFSKTI